MNVWMNEIIFSERWFPEIPEDNMTANKTEMSPGLEAEVAWVEVDRYQWMGRKDVKWVEIWLEQVKKEVQESGEMLGILEYRDLYHPSQTGTLETIPTKFPAACSGHIQRGWSCLQVEGSLDMSRCRQGPPQYWLHAQESATGSKCPHYERKYRGGLEPGWYILFSPSTCSLENPSSE